jgi:endonuclease/exonuclease/phosphatase family metal-dependent hydrolase
MIGRVESFFRSIRQTLSRSDWAIRLLKLSRLNHPTSEPGLVLIQIDGLSHSQFNRALKKGHVSFLAHLLTKERYIQHQFYSGLPSNTPSVQAELFYGIKGCVPSFSFIDRPTNQIIKMLDTPFVEAFEHKLKKQAEGLLKEGSSYSNIYTGGAKESHFCFAQLGWSGIFHAARPRNFPFLLILYIDIFFRTFFLLILEFFIALFECVRGTLKGRIFWEELRFVWLRVLVCVFLKEIIVAAVCMDIMRGLPIIHLNFLGYDEQAHCRGPASSYAHWSLQGIDDAIKRINNVIRQSPYRQYDLWIYSDHGQDTTTPYLIKHGLTVEESIQNLFGKVVRPQLSRQEITRADSRVKLLRKEATYKPLPLADFSTQDVIVTAMGPLGQIYLKNKLGEKELDLFAHQLTSKLKIPLVLRRYQDNKAMAYTPKGSFILPEQTGDVFGNDHPFLEDIKEDVLRICWHPNAGELTMAGWSYGQKPISFPLEYGAHAGMSIEETRAFALLPMDAALKYHHKTYLRPTDLREAVLNHLNKGKSRAPFLSARTVKSLKIMSYNVHGCMGMDGQISTDRIARVIARHNPDVIALQELDALRKRSNGIDQAHRIAQYLEMKYHFHPVFCHEEEQYGNAILSRYPLTMVKMDALPRLKEESKYEPRGAMSVILEFQGVKINIINTHLSIWPTERIMQAETLLNKEWFSGKPTILCGDFNAIPGSSAYKKLSEKFRDSQTILSGHRPYRTWFGRYPLSQIDHVFVTTHFKVDSIAVPRTSLDQVASDHLPLIVDLSFISN